MSKTSLILEALFTGADEEECARRDAAAPKIIRDEWIEEFLKRDDVRKNPDGSYDVDGNVFLSRVKLQKLPVKFHNVYGTFYCDNMGLTTLEGAPETVGDASIHFGGSFWCDRNDLTSLEGAPKKVAGNFGCYMNKKQFSEDEVKAVCEVGRNILTVIK